MVSVERTAYPRFKRTISSRELHESFTPGPSEVAWARGKARSAEHLLALVVLLKSYQKLGCFPDLAEVPALVVEHVRDLLGLGEEVAPTHDSARMLRHHRTIVRERLGVVYDKEKARKISAAAIYEAVQTKDNPADLINVALEKLVKARLELPGYSTLDEMASAIRTEANEDFFARVVSHMDEVEQARLLALLRVVAGSRSKFRRAQAAGEGTDGLPSARAPEAPGLPGAAGADGEVARRGAAGESGALCRTGEGPGRRGDVQGRRGEAARAAGEPAAHDEGAGPRRAGDDAVQAHVVGHEEGQGGPGEDP
ncbi:DUF4158 domain-containing protein [Streptomyces sp. NPDC002206]